jgi:hypothetical protein
MTDTPRPGFAGGPDPVQVAAGTDGSLTYLVSRPPEALPPVRPRDLEAAWIQAREAARARRFGAPMQFRFRREDGSVTDLALTDADARCWAHAVDAGWGIDTLPGLAVCLRLLALVDLLGRAPWAAPLVRFAPDGAEIDPRLLRLVAAAPLNRDARFDDGFLRDRLGARDRVLSAPKPRPTGARP